jgi:hypothetical protein
MFERPSYGGHPEFTQPAGQTRNTDGIVPLTSPWNVVGYGVVLDGRRVQMGVSVEILVLVEG